MWNKNNKTKWFTNEKDAFNFLMKNDVYNKYKIFFEMDKNDLIQKYNFFFEDDFITKCDLSDNLIKRNMIH